MGLRGGVAAADGVVAADADVAKAMSAAGRRQTAKAASRPVMWPKVRPVLQIRIRTMSRCRWGMACDLPPGRQPTPAGRIHPGIMMAASHPAPPGPTTASLANQVVDADDVADVAKDGVAMPAAQQHRPRGAARAPHRDVRARAVQVKPVRATRGAGVAAAAAGVRVTSVVRPPRSNAVAAMNLPPWREAARRTTRALSSSGSRMPAMKATSVTNVTRQTTMTASSRAA
jgi:hypothetical protein